MWFIPQNVSSIFLPHITKFLLETSTLFAHVTQSKNKFYVFLKSFKSRHFKFLISWKAEINSFRLKRTKENIYVYKLRTNHLFKFRPSLSRATEKKIHLLVRQIYNALGKRNRFHILRAASSSFRLIETISSLRFAVTFFLHLLSLANFSHHTEALML